MSRRVYERGRALSLLAVKGMTLGAAGCAGSGMDPVVTVEIPKAAEPAEDPAPNQRPRRAKSCCKGMNACKGLGMCKTDKHDCKGINMCKGLGGCKPAVCPKR